MTESSKASDLCGKVEIKVLQATNLTTLGRSPFDDKFSVKLSLGNQTFTARAKKRGKLGAGSSVSWNKLFPFVFAGQMPNLTLEVSAQESDRRDIFIGKTVVSYAALSSAGPPAVGVAKLCSLSLSDENGQAIAKPKAPTLKISVKIISTGIEEHVDDLGPILEEAELSIQQASEALGQLKGPKIPGFPLKGGTSSSAVAGTAGDLSKILSKIGTIANIMDELTEIHPYAKAAWDILDLTRKVIKAQIQEDDSIRELSEQMRSLWDRIRKFVEKLEGISPADVHMDEKDILQRVANTSHECAKFVVTFCDSNFGKRAMKCALFGGASKTIRDFKSKFESLEKSFNERVWDGTSLVARQILENQMAAQLDKYIVSGASLLASDKPSCFTGTRIAIRKEITDWISRDDEDVPRVLLLSGMAGTGKSTIAVTIARDCHEQSRLGASFAFNRRAQPRPAPKELFPHIAASLAAFYPAVKNAFSDTQKKEIASGSDLEGQLRNLIVEPLNQSNTPTGVTGVRIVGIIDALDEADDDREQTIKLASLLATQCSKLPSNIRILVTSRPEADVLEEMPPHAVLRLSMPDSSEINMFDVGLFVRDQLLSRPLEGIDEECCAKLAETSQGLFQWAATACKVIKPPLPVGSTSRKGYDMVITSGIGRDKSGLLDSLYKGVLERIGDPDKNPDGHQLLREVLATLFILMEPMTLEDLRQLYVQLGFGEESDVDSTLPYLTSILDGISDRTRPLQPNHTSLRDFFLDPTRSGPFCVKDLLPAAHDRAARSSFKLVSTFRYHDICNLDFARIDDDEYLKPELDRVQRDMLPHLTYACLYCMKHLAEASMPEETFWTDMETSFLAGDHVLHWIEIFCLLVIPRLMIRDVTTRLRSIYRKTTPELNGCITLLAHITKQQGSSCPIRVQSFVEHASSIVYAKRNPPFLFYPSQTLSRLYDIYCSVGWTVKLQHQPKDGPSVMVGSGFFIKLYGAACDVIITTAHNLLNADGQPRMDLVVHIPKQVPRLNGASQFSDIQCAVLPRDIRVCTGFRQKRQLDTDWGVILFPRGTALGDGFEFNIKSQEPNTTNLGNYGRLSWIPYHLRHSGDNSNNLAHIAPTADRTRDSVTNIGDLVASGAPIYSSDIFITGIFNPHYGDEGYTKLTPALTRELGSLVGLGKNNTQLRWIPLSSGSEEDKKTHGVPNVDDTARLRVPPSRDNLYLFVNEDEGSRLYLKRGSGSFFDLSFLGTDSFRFSLGFGSMLVETLEKDDKDTRRLGCVSALDYKGGRGLRVWMVQHVDEDQQTARDTVTIGYRGYFDVEHTPITSSSYGDLELSKISLRHGGSGVEQGLTRYRNLKFALE